MSPPVAHQPEEISLPTLAEEELKQKGLEKRLSKPFLFVLL